MKGLTNTKTERHGVITELCEVWIFREGLQLAPNKRHA